MTLIGFKYTVYSGVQVNGSCYLLAKVELGSWIRESQISIIINVMLTSVTWYSNSFIHYGDLHVLSTINSPVEPSATTIKLFDQKYTLIAC